MDGVVVFKAIEFSCPSSRSDAILKVQGKVLHVSTAVLCIASPVFTAMFQAAFKDQSSHQILNLPGKKYDDVVEFLRNIYPNSPRLITDENMEILLTYADEYQVEQLKTSCEQYVRDYVKQSTKDFKRIPQLFHYLSVSDRFNLTIPYQQCVARLSCLRFADKADVKGLLSYNEFNLLQLSNRYDILLTKVTRLERAGHC